MAVVLVHQGPSVTQEKYEEIVRKLTGGKSRLESPSDWPVAGLLVHAAGQAEGGFRVVDVWESEEACKQFGETLAPILRRSASTTSRSSIRQTRSSRRDAGLTAT